MGAKEFYPYVSKDPVLAARDALVDARAAYRGAIWELTIRIAGSVVGIGGPLGLMIWLCVSASGAPSGSSVWAGVIFGWIGWLILSWGVVYLIWTHYDSTRRQRRQGVRLAARRLRDEKAKAVADSRLQSEAQALAREKLAEKIVAEYRSPGADA